MSKIEKAIRAEWVAAGKHKEEGNELFKNYKNARREYRKKIRKAQFEYEVSEHKNMAEQEQISSDYFWYMVNKKRNQKKSQQLSPILSEEGVMLTEIEDQVQNLRIYFKN